MSLFKKKNKQPSLHKALRRQKYFFGVSLIILNFFNLYCQYYAFGLNSTGLILIIITSILFIPGIYVIIRTLRTPTRFDDDKDALLITISFMIIIGFIFGAFDI